MSQPSDRVLPKLLLAWAITVCLVILMLAMSSCVHGDPVAADQLPCQCVTDEECATLYVYASIDAYGNVAQDSTAWRCER